MLEDAAGIRRVVIACGYVDLRKGIDQEQKDYETIEADIAALEEKIGKLDEEMAAVSTDFVKLNQLTAEKEETEKLLEEKMDRWMYLEELAARIAEQ